MNNFDIPDAPWWCLMIVDKGGGQHRVYGPKDDLMPFYTRWDENNFVDTDRLSIKGACDSCDRAPSMMSFDPDFIGAVHLTLYS